MRELTGHKVNGVNDGLAVKSLDVPGHGGACHRYAITFTTNGSIDNHYAINFQDGPIKEVGVNGLTHESLLAILIDRLEGFQGGKYACDDNAEALVNLCAAQRVLKRRTQVRASRGVEGTHAV